MSGARDLAHAEDAAAFQEARLLAGLTRKQCAALLRVSGRTVRNWERGRARVPYSAFRLVQIFGGYELPGAAWRGWRLYGDAMWSPEGHGFKAHELVYWGLTVAMAREFLHQRDSRFQPLHAGDVVHPPLTSHVAVIASPVSSASAASKRQPGRDAAPAGGPRDGDRRHGVAAGFPGCPATASATARGAS